MPIIGKHYDLDTDGTLANNSDNTIASQKAVKTYVDNKTVVDSSLSNSSENPVQNKVIKSALDNKQDTISDLGYIRNKVALVDDKISAIDVTDSGSSLPAASGYDLNDTFVNKTDKKLYKVEAPAYALNSSVSKSSGITVDLITGVATGFSTTSNPGGTWTTCMSNSYNTNIATAPIYVHFKTGSTLPSYDQYIFLNSVQVTYYSSYFGVKGSTTLNLVCNRYITSTGQIESVFNYPLFDTVLEANTEYYLYLEYNNGEYIATLSSTGYNINILETSTIEESTTPGCTTFYYGGPNNRYTTFNGMSVYLLDSTGNFLVADGELTWDSGTTLEDNTQYNDTTNEKVIYYNNNILYEDESELPDQTGQSGKVLTTNGSTISWGSISANNVTTALGYTPYNSTNPNGYTSNTGTVTSVQVQAGTGLTSSTSTAQNTTLNTTISIASGYKLPTTTEWNSKQDALPAQSGNTGKFLTTNGSTMSWATVDALPSQSGNSGKYLTTNGSSASWASITIPTVNDAVLTIQQNGTTMATFSANASTAATANVSTTIVKFRDWSD